LSLSAAFIKWETILKTVVISGGIAGIETIPLAEARISFTNIFGGKPLSSEAHLSQHE
jgi:hypothetical protein